jgi:hypothetical protein
MYEFKKRLLVLGLSIYFLVVNEKERAEEQAVLGTTFFSGFITTGTEYFGYPWCKRSITCNWSVGNRQAETMECPFQLVQFAVHSWSCYTGLCARFIQTQ